MKNKSILSAGLILIAGLGLAFADTAEKTVLIQTPSVKQQDGKIKEFKDILFKLVRQDEYLDEALETLDSSSGPAGAEDLAALGVSLKTIAGNLKHISSLNKTEFSSIQPGSALSNYTNTILSYSRKVNRKVGKVNVLVAQLAAKNKKASMRDAVSSKGGKKVRGKKLTQILDEKAAVEKLSADVRNLRAASRDLAATSKWLYIASQ